jgi:DNA-binding CsgD family transcriptional regulator
MRRVAGPNVRQLRSATLADGEDTCLNRLEFARRSRDPSELCHAQAWLAYVAALQGSWVEVQDIIAQVRPAAERLPSTEALTFVLKAGGIRAYWLGDYLAAEWHFLAVEELFRQAPHALGRYRGGLLGLAQLALGKPGDARAFMASQEKIVAVLPGQSTPTAPILTSLAMMAVQSGDHPRAIGYYERLLPFQGQYYWFLVDRILAMIETLQGNWLAAEGHLDSAEALSSRENIRPELPLVLAARADLEVARGGRGSAIRARTLLARALDLFGELGMAGEVSRVRDRLRRLPSQPGADHPEYPAGLSAREVQILRLVAGGMSNRRIAKKLALSENTVANHLTSIFNKIGADNRASATAFAVRHGLA